MPVPRIALSKLEYEQAQDLRRSVLCGELNWGREAVDDGWDSDAAVALVLDGPKPVATGRLIHRSQRWWVDLVAVLPKQRRQGLGRELVGFLADLGRQKGAPEVWILSPVASAPFFQACGFIGEAVEGALCLLSRRLD